MLMSTVRLLVLGSILKQGTSHGYAVYSEITSWHAETWTNVKPGSIYHALDRLRLQGLIKKVNSKDSVKLGPSRTEYEITRQGKNEFTKLLESALVSINIQHFAVGIAFMEMFSREKVIKLLEKRCIAFDSSVNFLESLSTDEFTQKPSMHPELVGIWISYVKNEVSSTKRILINLRAGKYAFKSKITKEHENEIS